MIEEMKLLPAMTATRLARVIEAQRRFADAIEACGRAASECVESFRDANERMIRFNAAALRYYKGKPAR